MTRLHLPSLPTVLLTIDRNSRRHERMVRFFADHKYTNVEWIFGTPAKDRVQGVSKTATEVLRSIKCPCLWLEDDAVPTADYRETIHVPDDASWVYLGGGRYGQSAKVMRAATGRTFAGGRQPRVALEPTPCYNSLRTLYADTYNPDLVHIVSMSTAHAILWLNPYLCRNLADKIEAAQIDYDHVLAVHQWWTFCYGTRRPWFWQDDGRHEHTKDYFPLYGG